MPKTFSEQLHRIEGDVIEALLAVLPEGWTSIELAVTTTDGAAFTMQIATPGETSSTLKPAPELSAAIADIYGLCAQEKQPWQSAHYVAQLDESFDDWGYSVDYT